MHNNNFQAFFAPEVAGEAAAAATVTALAAEADAATAAADATDAADAAADAAAEAAAAANDIQGRTSFYIQGKEEASVLADNAATQARAFAEATASTAKAAAAAATAAAAVAVAAVSTFAAANTTAAQACDKKNYSREAQMQRDRVRRVWASWERAWNAVNADFDYSALSETCTYEDIWADRACKIRVLMHRYVSNWVACVGATQGLYLHILVAHLPDQIERWGDLRVRSSQGLEHCHKRRKKIGCDATNRKKGQRLETMLTHIVVLDHIHRLLDEDYHASTHARKKNSKLRRLTAKIARMNIMSDPQSTERTTDFPSE